MSYIKEKFRQHLIDCNGAMYKDYIDTQFEADVLRFLTDFTDAKSKEYKELLSKARPVWKEESDKYAEWYIKADELLNPKP